MELFDFISEFWRTNPSVMFLSVFLLTIGTIGKIMLFSKCNHPWWAAFIPVYDFIILLKIIGRPPLHLFMLLIPVFNIYFVIRVFIELTQSFGKYSIVDYILITVFNVFYIMNLGLSYTEYYYGPVYGKRVEELKTRKEPLFA